MNSPNVKLPPADVIACGARPDVPLCVDCTSAYRNGIEPLGTACDRRYDEAEQTAGQRELERCHCGADMGGSDHCWNCACEQYERDCGWRPTFVAIEYPDGSEARWAIPAGPEGDRKVAAAEYVLGDVDTIRL